MPTPQSLDEIIALGAISTGEYAAGLTNLYLEATPGRDISKTRNAQLELMEQTLKLLGSMKPPELKVPSYSAEEKAKITKGLMLVIKNQIEHETFSFNSTLKSMVNHFLNVEDLKNTTADATESIQAFHDFVNNKDFPKHSAPSKGMMKKIRRALFDSSYDKIKAIDSSINSSISILENNKVKLSYHQKLILNGEYTARDERGSERTKERMTPKFVPNIGLIFQPLLDIQESIRKLSDPLNDTGLLLRLKRAKVELENVRLDIEAARHKYDKLDPANQALFIQNLNKFKELEKICADATNKLALPKPKLESKVAAEPAPKNKTGLFSSLKLFNKTSKAREIIKNNVVILQKKIPEIAESDLLTSHASDGEINAANLLTVIKQYHDNMSKENPKGNLPFKQLMIAAEKLNRYISEAKDKVTTTSESRHTSPQQVDRSLKLLNTELEALRYLLKIAELKVNAPQMSRMGINDSQVKELNELFVTLGSNLDGVGSVRSRAHPQA